MNHATLQQYFMLSFVGIGLGLICMLLWAKKIYKPLVSKMSQFKVISPRIASIPAFIYMLPGILIFFASSVPTLYFNHLLKQEEYCRQIIQVNKDITKTSSFLQERCGRFDLDALFAEQRGG